MQWCSRLRHDACTRYGGIRRRSSAVQPGPHLSARRATKQRATAVSQRPAAARNPGPWRCRRRFLLLARINSGSSLLSHTDSRRFLLIRARNFLQQPLGRLRLRCLYLRKKPTGTEEAGSAKPSTQEKPATSSTPISLPECWWRLQLSGVFASVRLTFCVYEF